MGTENNPDIGVYYYDDPSWVNILSDCKNFQIRDAGILKIPYATIELLEPANLPSLYDLFKMEVNATGSSYQPFYGRVEAIERLPLGGTINKKSYRLTAFGLEKRLKRDTITWDYTSEQESRDPESKWSFKTMIENFLGLPDSGYDTGITLDTDDGEAWEHITDDVYGECDFEQQSLLGAMRIIAETLGYDGYVYLDGATQKLKFYKSGYLATSPATTLSDPFVREPSYEQNIDEVKNYIFVFGGTDIGYPHDQDKFTEHVVAKYTGINAVWEALGGQTLADSSVTKYNEAGSPHQSDYSLQVSILSGETGIRFRVDRTSLAEANIESRFSSLDFIGYFAISSGNVPTCKAYIKCTDDNDDTIRCGSLTIATDQWVSVNIPMPLDKDIADYPPPTWRYTGGSTSFNKDKVKYIDLIVEEYTNQFRIYLDWWHLTGGKLINPFINPSAYPSPAVDGAVKDDTSINNYGVRVHSYENQKIQSFEEAVQVGKRILAVWKDPIRTVTCVKKGYCWLRSNQNVTINSSTLGISSETWRTRELTWDWNSKTKVVYATIQSVPQYAITPPVYIPTGYIPAPQTVLPPSLVKRIPPWI